MSETVNFYMYTANMPPMHKGRVEKQLRKTVRCQHMVMSCAEYVAFLARQTYRPHIAKYLTRTGGTTTEYTMIDSRCSGYTLPNKTIYTFAEYLVEQGAVTKEAQQVLYDQEATHVAELDRLEHEEQKRVLAEQQKAREAYTAYKKWFDEEADKRTDDPRIKTIHQITEKQYGWQNPRYASKLLVRIDNLHLNNPWLMKSLCEMLAPMNKASREAFQTITGMKLPKGLKATRIFVQALGASGETVQRL